MLKVLIVDDELLIRNHIKSLIRWENSGYELCSEAMNGLQALEAISQYCPNIVISDIKMPVMNGVELIQRINKKYPEIKTIALSNYDDFDYVKEALKNGAIDYILKHTISESVMLEALKEAGKAIIINNDRVRLSDSKNMMLRRKEFLIEFLAGLYDNVDEIEKKMESLNIRLQGGLLFAIIMSFDLKTSSHVSEDSEQRKAAIYSITEEILNEYHCGIISNIMDEKYLLLLSLDNAENTIQTNQLFNDILHRISICLKEFINTTVTFSVGEPIGCIKDLPYSYKSAENKLKDKRSDANLPSHESVYISSENVFWAGLHIDKEKRIVSYIKNLNRIALRDEINDIFSAIPANMNVKAVSMFSDLLSIICRISKEYGIELYHVFLSYDPPYRLLGKFGTIEETKHWISDHFFKLIKLLELRLSNKHTHYSQQALSYIAENYSKDISLETVSSHINVSSTYLSTIFKTEVGQGFTDYLIHYRLNKAKELLIDGKLDIKEIVEVCGFNDYAYFFKIFKKKSGVTPKEFIKDRLKNIN